uniref:Putative ovule protein n=1 Tax=Solanum chacoense TaxID=4108 RepID=A0A0V0IZP8_SOLCH
MLHWYVRDGDMIVDFCCGSNDFSCLMKKKLDGIGKGCLYKNYDLFSPKNDFNFEKRDWMTVKSDELPEGSKLIMGLNPPFGVNAALANKFVNKALEFKPKLLILIVPKETERLDVKKGSPYDLIWEDDALLGGKSFYLPGSVDQNDKQMDDWNVSAPPLYLWSRTDWTTIHKVIAQQHGHPSNIKLEENFSHTPAPRSLKHEEDVSTRINNDTGFEDKKQHQHQEYKERSQNNSGKEVSDKQIHGKKKSDEKSKNGSQDKSKNKFDNKSMRESQDRSKYQRDLDEKSRQDKFTAKRKRDLDEKATEDKSIGKSSLSSSPRVTNHKSVDRHTISSSKAEENEDYQRFAGQSAAASLREQETGYGVHQDRDLERMHILRTEEPYSGLTHQYPQSASPGPEYMGHRAHLDGDMARRNGLPMQEPYSSLNHQYSQSSSPGRQFAFRSSDERFVGYQRDHADIPGYRPYTSHSNGGMYARESDVRPQGNLYGQQCDGYLPPRSNYVAGACPGYHPSPTDPTYGRINTPVQQYAPQDELYPGRMSSMGSEGRSNIYGGGIARPGFQGNSLGFAPRPYHPYSQQNSSGWLNE